MSIAATYRIFLISLLTLFFVCTNKVKAQADLEMDQFIEKYLEMNEGNEEIDLNEIKEIFEFRQENPLNLNTCDENDLKEIFFLSDQQIMSFLDYRSKLGNLISKYELQSIPLFDINTVRMLSAFSTIGDAGLNYNVNIWKMFLNSKKDLVLKSKTILEQKQGFVAKDTISPKYAGDKMTYYTRLKFKYENRLDAGIIAEKDPGELFFKGYNKHGFDYYSAHLFVYKPTHWLKELNIGDYTVSLGQGLIRSNDFGRGKSSIVNSIKKNSSRVIRPYNSVNESMYLRGLGATLAILKNLDLSLFGSFKKIDGNLNDDIIEVEDDELYTSSIQISGFHRTLSEIENKHTINELTFGGRFNYKIRHGYIGLNYFDLKYDKPLIRDEKLYNKFTFSGDHLVNLSLDYSYIFHRILMFGEVSRSKNGALAYIQGLQLVPSSKFDISILYRNYPKDYQSINSNSFGESIGTNNEEGIYAALNFNINRRWSMSFYHDIWRNKWLRSGISTPSVGNEFFGIVKYTIRHFLTCYIQFKNESKATDNSLLISKTKITEQGLKNRIRFNFDIMLNKYLELRNRIELCNYTLSGNTSKGFLASQDIIYRPVGFPIDFSLRYAIFDTDDFNSAIYAYENDLIGESYIPVYYKKGYRTYFNISYSVNSNTRIEMRLGRWYYPNETSLGTGNEMIIGNKKTDFKIQARLKL